MQINVTYDASVSPTNFSGGAAEEAQFKNAISYVVNLYDNLFVNDKGTSPSPPPAAERCGGGPESAEAIQNPP